MRNCDCDRSSDDWLLILASLLAIGYYNIYIKPEEKKEEKGEQTLESGIKRCNAEVADNIPEAT